MNRQNLNTAILFFSRRAEAEINFKTFSTDRSDALKIAGLLYAHTLQMIHKSGLPFFIIDESMQKGADFGEKLSNAISFVFAEGAENIVVLGADCPGLGVEDLREADRLVLASPIFFMGVTAQAKAMIDRCQALWVIKYVLELPVAINPDRERKGIFVSVGGTRLHNLFQPAMATVKSWFLALDIKYDGELVFSEIDEKGAILRQPTALKEAFVAGQKLVADNIPR